MADIGTLRDESFVKGDTFTEPLVFTEIIDDVETPFDLTIYSDIRMDVRNKPYESATRFLSLSLGNGISISGDDNNILIISLTAEDTELLATNHNQLASSGTYTLSGDRYYYRDIRFIIGDEVATKLNGRYKVINNITDIS